MTDPYKQRDRYWKVVQQRAPFRHFILRDEGGTKSDRWKEHFTELLNPPLIYSLRIIIHNCIEINISTCINFVEATFDSIRQDFIWKSIRHFGLPEKLIRIFQAFFNGALWVQLEWMGSWQIGLMLNQVQEKEIFKVHQFLTSVLTLQHIWPRQTRTFVMALTLRHADYADGHLKRWYAGVYRPLGS